MYLLFCAIVHLPPSHIIKIWLLITLTKGATLTTAQGSWS